MASDHDEFQSRIIVTPHSEHMARASRMSTPATGRDAEASAQDRARMGRPAGIGDPLNKRLVMRALFPSRAQPVQIGRFSVLRLIGRGGMGAVYACYDEVLDRKVAVKILHLERSEELDIASTRLVREGQALAKLAHPNVVAVHEVGRADDQVYVAMEFVQGTSLDAWAAHERPWREILSAFVQAGRGLIAAHRAEIVHRDFKPQNVLMSEEGVVKVLDFGLARASGEEIKEEWLTSQSGSASVSGSELMRPLTRTGALIGTPLYMAPEQHRGQIATAASDQFSFCVSLYQCLYGIVPFATKSFSDLRRAVLEGQIAAPPMRSPVPLRVYRALRRGMSADPAARFPSMNELLATLERDPATIRRRIGALAVTAAATGVAGFMVAGVSGSSLVEVCPDARSELAGVWDDARAETVRGAVRTTRSPRADEVLGLLEPHLERYAGEWTRMRNEACRVHAEGLQSSHVFDLRMACLDQRRAGLQAVAEALVTADAAGLDKLAEAAVALPPLDRCADTEALLAAVAPPEDPRLRARVQQHRQSLARAQVLEDAGQPRPGLALVENVLADEQAMTYEPLVAEAYLHRGNLQLVSGAGEDAVQSFNRSFLTAIGAGHWPVAALAGSKIGFVQAVMLGQLERAKLELPTIEALSRQAQEDVDVYAESLNNLGWIHAVTGNRPEGRRLLEMARTLRATHQREQTLKGLATLMNLGLLAQHDGRIGDMEKTTRRLAAVSQEILGPTHAFSHWAAALHGSSSCELGRPAEAREELERAIARTVRAENADGRARLLRTLAFCELADGHEKLAGDHLRAALPLVPAASIQYDDILMQLMRAAAGAGDEIGMRTYHDAASRRIDATRDSADLLRAKLLQNHALALEALDRPSEALASYEQLRPMLAVTVVPTEPELGARVSFGIGRVHRELGEHDAAERELQRALRELEEAWPVRGLLHAELLLELGELALERGRDDEALKHLLAAESLFAATAEPHYLPFVRARFALARAQAGGTNPAPDAARARAEEALQAFRARGRTDEARTVESWLAGRG